MTQRRQTSQPRPVAKPEPNSIQLEDLPLRPELIGAEPYGAPQLDVPVCLKPPVFAKTWPDISALVSVAPRFGLLMAPTKL